MAVICGDTGNFIVPGKIMYRDLHEFFPENLPATCRISWKNQDANIAQCHRRAIIHFFNPKNIFKASHPLLFDLIFFHEIKKSTTAPKMYETFFGEKDKAGLAGRGSEIIDGTFYFARNRSFQAALTKNFQNY
jgi:hypothetical protein